MSYEIIRGLTYDKNTKKVYIRSSSNNVWPKDYYKTELEDLSLKIQGGETTFEQFERDLLEDVVLGNGNIRLEIQKYKRAYAKSLFENPDLFDPRRLKLNDSLLEEAVTVFQNNIGKNTKGRYYILMEYITKGGTSPIGVLTKSGKRGFSYAYINSWATSDSEPAGSKCFTCLEDAMVVALKHSHGDKKASIFEEGNVVKYINRDLVLMRIAMFKQYNLSIVNVKEEEDKYLVELNTGKSITVFKDALDGKLDADADLDTIEKKVSKKRYKMY